MKLPEVKNPVTGGKISLSLMSIIGLILGSALLMFVWDIGKKLNSVVSGKLPRSVKGLGATPNTDPYAAKIIY